MKMINAFNLAQGVVWLTLFLATGMAGFLLAAAFGLLGFAIGVSAE